MIEIKTKPHEQQQHNYFKNTKPIKEKSIKELEFKKDPKKTLMCNKCKKNKVRYTTEFKGYSFVYPYIKLGFCEKCFKKGDLKPTLKGDFIK